MTKLREKIITQGPEVVPKYSQKVDFKKNKFDNLVQTQGYNVIFEKAISCPCNNGSGFKNTCKNCRGTGWIFVNPQVSKAIMNYEKVNPKEENYLKTSGSVKITTFAEVELSYFDKIIVVDSLSSFTESLTLQYDETLKTYFAATTYPIKEIYFLGLLKDEESKLVKIDSNYRIDEDFIIFEKEYIDNLLIGLDVNIPTNYDIYNLNLSENKKINISIRYKHNPIYHITEMLRDYMTHPVKLTSSNLTRNKLPIHGIAQKRDMLIDKENISGNKLIDNSWITNG